jgi:hypothetical protein
VEGDTVTIPRRRIPGLLQRDGDDLRAALREICAVADSATAGELEPRVAPLGQDADVQAARTAVNGLLDVIDAYVRESSAAIYASSHGRFYRRLLEGGLHGAFKGRRPHHRLGSGGDGDGGRERHQRGVRPQHPGGRSGEHHPGCV